MEIWFKRMSVEEKKWLEFFLLDKLEEYRKNRISAMDDESHKLPETEIETYIRFCKHEINMCVNLIDKYNEDCTDIVEFGEVSPKRTPPAF